MKTNTESKKQDSNKDFINFSINYSEGLKLIKTQPLKSIECINKALNYTKTNNNNKKKCLQTRSHCYQILGKIEESLNDANEALSLETNNPYSILLKAEALYYKGEFEWALMYFHQGKRLRSNMNKFQIGINKCIKAIENTFYSTSSIIIQQVTSIILRDNKKDIDKKLLGELHQDLKYLNEINSKNNYLKENFDTKLKDLCSDGLEYFNSRLEFLRQQK
jgi:tetratricopeptide repeat protein 25